MAVAAVVFDVGETLVDETAMWSEVADRAGVPRFTLFALVGGLAARGEHWRRAFELLEVGDATASPFAPTSLYEDVRPVLRALRERGLRVGLAGNASSVAAYAALGLDADFVGSSGDWGAAKPAPAFFERVVEEAGLPREQIAYVGDRVDYDVEPALAAGMVAVHVRRGPWGLLHDPPPEAIRIRSLAELPEVLDG